MDFLCGNAKSPINLGEIVEQYMRIYGLPKISVLGYIFRRNSVGIVGKKCDSREANFFLAHNEY